ncbi:STAS domain-containing protein, partial [Streptosporangium sp. NPDC052375]|uniref:STAS domain-containing protein n=1 Tax=Streptosporangium sp. NPDC052375 TaxID=3366195 RepID=UPI0037D32DE0
MRVPGNPGAQVISVGNRLDVGTVAGMRPRLHEAVDSGSGDLIVDLSGLEMIDATGLGVLVGTHRRGGGGGGPGRRRGGGPAGRRRRGGSPRPPRSAPTRPRSG